MKIFVGIQGLLIDRLCVCENLDSLDGGKRWGSTRYGGYKELLSEPARPVRLLYSLCSIASSGKRAISFGEWWGVILYLETRRLDEFILIT